MTTMILIVVAFLALFGLGLVSLCVYLVRRKDWEVKRGGEGGSSSGFDTTTRNP